MVDSKLSMGGEGRVVSTKLTSFVVLVGGSRSDEWQSFPCCQLLQYGGKVVFMGFL